jgi:hypothetical protein
MLYALLCYHDEAEVNAWTKEQDDAVLTKRATVTDKLRPTASSVRRCA